LEDPLISAANELATLRARSPAYARELADWSGDAFAALGYEETDDEKRYRRAACLIADISWRAHPDYRGSQALNMISNAAFIGIDHPGRAYIALANFFRHEGVANSVPDPELAAIASPRLLEFSRLLAAIMRITYPFSASMSGVLPRLSWMPDSHGIDLVIDKAKADLIGDIPEGRLQQLGKLTGRQLRLVVGS
ncbi:MAG: exopolyphosphatase, partial [Alphaproteobacteria bacterium]